MDRQNFIEDSDITFIIKKKIKITPESSVPTFVHNCLYAQLHYFLNISQLLITFLPLLDKLINSGVPDLSSHGNNNQTHLN